MMASAEETRPLLGTVEDGSSYGAAAENLDFSVNRRRRRSSPERAAPAATGARDSSDGAVQDTIPYMLINPGIPINDSESAQAPAEISTSTLFEEGEERFRLRRRQLEEERATAGRELNVRRPRGGSLSSQPVHIKWTKVNVHLERSATWKQRLGLERDDAEAEDVTDSENFESNRERPVRKKIILDNGQFDSELKKIGKLWNRMCMVTLLQYTRLTANRAL